MSSIRAHRLLTSVALALSLCLAAAYVLAQETKSYDCTVTYTPKGRPSAKGVSKLQEPAESESAAEAQLRTRFEENGNTNVNATCTDTPKSPFLR